MAQIKEKKPPFGYGTLRENQARIALFVEEQCTLRVTLYILVQADKKIKFILVVWTI